MGLKVAKNQIFKKSSRLVQTIASSKFKVQISKAVKISTVGILDYKWSNTVNFPA